MNDLPELWDIDRLAGYLSVSKHFVYRLTRERRIRFVRVGKEVRFRPEDVTAWLEAESIPAAGSHPSLAGQGGDGPAPVTGWRRDRPPLAARCP